MVVGTEKVTKLVPTGRWVRSSGARLVGVVLMALEALPAPPLLLAVTLQERVTPPFMPVTVMGLAVPVALKSVLPAAVQVAV